MERRGEGRCVRQTDGPAYRQMDGYGQTGIQTDGETDEWTDRDEPRSWHTNGGHAKSERIAYGCKPKHTGRHTQTYTQKKRPNNRKILVEGRSNAETEKCRQRQAYRQALPYTQAYNHTHGQTCTKTETHRHTKRLTQI